MNFNIPVSSASGLRGQRVNRGLVNVKCMMRTGRRWPAPTATSTTLLTSSPQSPVNLIGFVILIITLQTSSQLPALALSQGPSSLDYLQISKFFSLHMDHFLLQIFNFLVSGYCRVGRKPIFFLSALIYLLFRLISLFLPKYFVLYNMAMFISSAGYPFSYLIPGMLIAEFTDDTYRSFTASFAWAVWVFGMAALPYVAYYAGTWFLIGLLTYLPLFVTFFYVPFVPESPRWLTTVGRIEEAAVILQRVAKVNGTEHKMSPAQIEAALNRVLAIQQQKEHRNIGVWTLFSRRNLAKNTLLLCISW